MSKPILDSMEGIVYHRDRQIRQLELMHAYIGSPFVVLGASQLIVNSILAGKPFVFIRIEDPEDPVPLPR